jgi:hypothetical protein
MAYIYYYFAFASLAPPSRPDEKNGIVTEYLFLRSSYIFLGRMVMHACCPFCESHHRIRPTRIIIIIVLRPIIIATTRKDFDDDDVVIDPSIRR